MMMYQMVFLKAGTDRTHDSVAAARIQQGHIDSIKKLAAEGKLVIAGTFGDQGDVLSLSWTQHEQEVIPKVVSSV